MFGGLERLFRRAEAERQVVEVEDTHLNGVSPATRISKGGQSFIVGVCGYNVVVFHDKSEQYPEVRLKTYRDALGVHDALVATLRLVLASRR